MPIFLSEAMTPFLATWNGVVTTPEQTANLLPGAVPQYGGAPQNVRSVAMSRTPVVIDQPDAPPVLAAGAPPSFRVTAPTDDFHQRIWVMPKELSLRNPTIGADIPIQLWNTFTEVPTNEYVTTLLEDLTGVEFDMPAGTVLDSLELKTANLSLTADAGFKMNGRVRFVFTAGEGVMLLIVERANIVPVVPDAPVTETWTWRSQVMVSENGAEQRVSLMASPRIKTDFNLTVIYPDEANSVIKQLYGDSASAIILPQYQYLAGIKQKAPVGATDVIVDPSVGDLRAGMSVVLIDRRKGITAINSITTIVGETVQLDTPLDYEFPKGAWLVPTSATYLNRKTTFQRAPADGYAILNTEATDIAYLDPWLDNPVAMPMFNGLPIIEDRPLVSGGMVRAEYDNGTEHLDFGNKITVISPWAHTQIELEREYFVDRFFNPTTLNLWRTFFDYTRGRVKPFYTPTYRPDLKIAEKPLPGAGQLLLDDSRYSSVFYGHSVMDQVAIYTAAGVHYTKVLSAVPDENERDTISLGAPLPSTAGWDDIKKISFLLRCRMATDTVELEHHAFHSIIRFGIRTTDQ